MTDVTAWTASLRGAATAWRDQQATLRSARSGLAGAEGTAGSAGPRVEPALTAFLDTWVEALKQHADTAERHADDLDASAAAYDATDEASHAAMAALLPWDQRTSRPEGP